MHVCSISDDQYQYLYLKYYYIRGPYLRIFTSGSVVTNSFFTVTANLDRHIHAVKLYFQWSFYHQEQ